MFVDPGPVIAHTTEAESRLPPLMDSLVEASAGDMGVFFVQTKDTYGNNLIQGGDMINVSMTKSDNEDIMYRGRVRDQGNGTYYVTYTIPVAGQYQVDVTSSGELVKTCTPPILTPKFRHRSYDGVHVYQTETKVFTEKHARTFV